MKKLLLLFMMIILGYFKSNSQPINWEWGISSISNHTDEGIAITYDNSQNSYSLGYTQNVSIKFGNKTSNKGGATYIVKQNKQGEVKWINRIKALPIGIAGGAENFYVSVHYENNLILNSDTVLSNSSGDAIIKYNASGEKVWVLKIDATDFGNGTKIITDKDENIYLYGSLSNNPNPRLFIYKYSKNKKLLWQLFSTPGAGYFTKMAANQNHFYLVGGFYNGEVTFKKDTLPTDSVPNQCILSDFIIKFKSDGTQCWSKTIQGSPIDIATDQKDNIYVAGNFNQPTITLDSIEVTNFQYGTNAFDFYIAKYSADGKTQWAIDYPENINRRITGIALDAHKNLYATTLLMHNIYLLKYNTIKGTKTREIATFSNDDINTPFPSANAIAIDHFDNIYITGQYTTNLFLTDSIVLHAKGKDRYNTKAFILKMGRCYKETPKNICYVSVNDQSKFNVIKWHKSSIPVHSEYIELYRETDNNNFILAGTVPASDSVFYDTDFSVFDSNPNKKASRYKYRVINACGIPSYFSSVSSSTLFIQNDEQGRFSIVNGFTNNSSYELIRDNCGTNNWIVVTDKLTESNQLVDPEYSKYKGIAKWRIRSKKTSDCCLKEKVYSNILPYKEITTTIKADEITLETKLFPNPAIDNFSITVNDNSEIHLLEIYNTYGSCVQRVQYPSPNNTIDISKLSNGLYTIWVTTKTGKSTLKLLVQK